MNFSPATIPFVKASACGNDFLIIDGSSAPPDIARFTTRICDRHAGVGADGVEWLFPATSADIRARLINADGSDAEISGNGTRCVAAHLCSEQPRERVLIQTDAGVKTCLLTAHRDATFEFETTMGEPHVSGEFTVKLSSRGVPGIRSSMGNPHFSTFVSEFPPDWREQGAEIQRSPEFKQGVNVEFVHVIDRSRIEVRFFERGVGETQSSGTGSCAAAVAAIFSKRAESPLRVHAPGGAQTVRWENEIFLRGPAQIVCRGEFFI